MHNKPDSGKSSDTVITAASNMSKNWKSEEIIHQIKNKMTIS